MFPLAGFSVNGESDEALLLNSCVCSLTCSDVVDSQALTLRYAVFVASRATVLYLCRRETTFTPMPLYDILRRIRVKRIDDLSEMTNYLMQVQLMDPWPSLIVIDSFVAYVEDVPPQQRLSACSQLAALLMDTCHALKCVALINCGSHADAEVVEHALPPYSERIFVAESDVFDRHLTIKCTSIDDLIDVPL